MTLTEKLTDGVSNPRMSDVKLVSNELQQDAAKLARDVWGVALLAGRQLEANGLMAARGATSAGGTCEVERNTMAERVLRPFASPA